MITFRGQSPQKLPFWGLNRHFKSNMRKIQIAISSDLCIKLTWNLRGSALRPATETSWVVSYCGKTILRWRTPFCKLIYRHISVKNHLIFMKFCTEQQILNWMNVTWSKNEKFALDRLRGLSSKPTPSSQNLQELNWTGFDTGDLGLLETSQWSRAYTSGHK